MLSPAETGVPELPIGLVLPNWPVTVVWIGPPEMNCPPEPLPFDPALSALLTGVPASPPDPGVCRIGGIVTTGAGGGAGGDGGGVTTGAVTLTVTVLTVLLLPSISESVTLIVRFPAVGVPELFS